MEKEIASTEVQITIVVKIWLTTQKRRPQQNHLIPILVFHYDTHTHTPTRVYASIILNAYPSNRRSSIPNHIEVKFIKLLNVIIRQSGGGLQSETHGWPFEQNCFALCGYLFVVAYFCGALSNRKTYNRNTRYDCMIIWNIFFGSLCSHHRIECC